MVKKTQQVRKKLAIQRRKNQEASAESEKSRNVSIEIDSKVQKFLEEQKVTSEFLREFTLAEETESLEQLLKRREIETRIRSNLEQTEENDQSNFRQFELKSSLMDEEIEQLKEQLATLTKEDENLKVTERSLMDYLNKLDQSDEFFANLEKWKKM